MSSRGAVFASHPNYSSNKETADEVVAEINTAGGSVRAVKADMSSGSEAGAQFDAAEQTFGGVDVVVNGNGIMKTDPLAQAGGGDYEKHFAVNVEGMFNTLRAHESLFEQRTGQDGPGAIRGCTPIAKSTSPASSKAMASSRAANARM